MLVIIGVGLTLALIIIGAVVIPTVKSIQQSNQEMYDLRVYLEKKRERSSKARSAVKQLEQIRDKVAGLDVYIYKSGEELQLITMLEDLANRHAITQRITNTNLDKVTNQRVTMALNLTGSYQRTLEYLRDMERAPYFISINRMVMTSFVDRSKPGVEPQVSLDLEFSLYVAN